jgi:hypothetical protein
LGLLTLSAICIALAIPRNDQPHSGAAPVSSGTASLQDATQLVDPLDPVLLRHRLLAAMDARIDEGAARAHLQARLVLDELIPLAYLGIDADPVDVGMRIKKVYPDTSAEAAGLREGDVLLAIGDDATGSQAAMGHAVRRHHPGERVELRIAREGAVQVLEAALGNRPEEDEDEDEQFAELRGIVPPPVTARVLDFASGTIGSTPAEIEASLCGHGRPPLWTLVQENGERFLRQADGDATGIRFPMGILRDVDGDDVLVEVRYRFTGGKTDRAAGVVIHYRDPWNYLVARVNALEQDLRIFCVANGQRRTLPDGRVAVPLDDHEWHTLSFRAEGPKLTATIDGKYTVTAYDTYHVRGGIGLWTKSDAITDFDDLRIAPVP